MPAQAAPWCRSAPRSGPAIPSSSANAGSDETRSVSSSPRKREALVAEGASETSEPGISRFRVWSFGPSRNDLLELLLQMLRQEAEATRPGDIRARLVVACPFVAVKAVLRARIGVDLDIGPFGADGLDIAQQDACIL